MHTTLPGRATGAPVRPDTAGRAASAAGSATAAARRDSPPPPKNAGPKSPAIPDTSRAVPAASSTAGTSAPRLPMRTNRMSLPLFRGGLATDDPGQEQREQ